MYSTGRPPGLRCVGEVDFTNHGDWQAALGTLPTADEVHLDLSELRFIDTHGTLILVEASQGATSDRRLVLHRPPMAMLLLLGQFWPAEAAIEVARS
ncbi:STAS domain-containing protein [Nocardia sp. NBC_01327]|uniref:STAS domain-containing protein n=1 Tax=Nocardia sp. NBC_01327 TaxID=2903593 RepID=UPI002E156609|nr:STAS domain-containing protein [Nocardia sp. NBC_01327]